MKLFLDSAALQALYARNDKYHPLAAQALKDLANQAVTFWVTDYVFDEAVTLIQNRIGPLAAHQCGEWLRTSARVRLARINVEQWEAAWSMFKHYDDQAFSFTDCTSFVVMRHLKLYEAFTFDQHFKQMGFRLWPR